VILEELEPIVEEAVRSLAQRLGLAVEILGKADGLLPRFGEFSTTLVQGLALRAMGLDVAAPPVCTPDPGIAAGPLPVRPPNLCAGCPHRGTYFAVRRVFGDDAVYSSDIGCYTLGILPPLRAADFLLCMGSSISAGSGLAKASGQTVVAFIGDSTFFHSGITGLVNAVYNRHDLLVVIVDNRTTAMTGHQPHPGVDETIQGPNPVRVDIEGLVRACGVAEVRRVNPLNHKAIRKVLEELKGLSGVRVLIAEEPCPLNARRLKKARPAQVAYVAKGCEGRLACLDELACPAFSKTPEGKPEINPILCSGCMLCLQVCTHIKARKRSDA
jgi:indolepyruvate ferredoxin oxidoreductase alpha subunit